MNYKKKAQEDKKKQRLRENWLMNLSSGDAEKYFTGKLAYMEDDPHLKQLPGRRVRVGEIDPITNSVRKRKPSPKSFTAKFISDCCQCNKLIRPGDCVRYVDDQVVHYNHRRPEPKPEVPCERCWLVHPGECD